MSLSRLLRRTPRILAVVAALVLTIAPRAEAGIIQVTDFTAAKGTITSFGWVWDQTDREITVTTNTSSDYLLQELYQPNAVNIGGATSISLTGTWTPAIGSGDFLVRLDNNGGSRASAVFSFNEFTGGAVTKSLNWVSNPANTTIDQVYIIGNGNSASAAGFFAVTNLTVSTGAVPEIDPASAGAAVATLFGALGLFERRGRRMQIARDHATPATAV